MKDGDEEERARQTDTQRNLGAPEAVVFLLLPFLEELQILVFSCPNLLFPKLVQVATKVLTHIYSCLVLLITGVV